MRNLWGIAVVGILAIAASIPMILKNASLSKTPPPFNSGPPRDRSDPQPAATAESGIASRSAHPLRSEQTASDPVTDPFAEILALVKTEPRRAQEIATELLKGGSGGSSTELFATRFAMELAAVDPKAAAQWIQSLPGESKLAAASLIAATWATPDVAAAPQWANEVLDTAMREKILEAVGSVVESGDKSAAALWAAKLSEAEDSDRHAALIARLWARADPQSTFNWASDLSEGPKRNRAF